jgi:hypothetical protein
MIFLIQYNRELGRIITMESFTDSDQKHAQEERLKLELNLAENGVDDEVVILEAKNEEAVRRTHRRYFEDLHELMFHTPEIDAELLHAR